MLIIRLPALTPFPGCSPNSTNKQSNILLLNWQKLLLSYSHLHDKLIFQDQHVAKLVYLTKFGWGGSRHIFTKCTFSWSQFFFSFMRHVGEMAALLLCIDSCTGVACALMFDSRCVFYLFIYLFFRNNLLSSTNWLP